MKNPIPLTAVQSDQAVNLSNKRRENPFVKSLLPLASAVVMVLSMGVMSPARAADYQFIADSGLYFGYGDQRSFEAITGTFSYDYGTNILSNVNVSFSGDVWTGVFATAFESWVKSGAVSGNAHLAFGVDPGVLADLQFSSHLDGSDTQSLFTQANGGAIYNLPGTKISSSAIGGVELATTIDPISPVPEPETYALMLAGLALVGAAARRRQAK